MVLSVKPLPNDSDELTVGKGHELQPKTVANAEYFWNKLLYLGRWTFVELHCFEDKLEGNWVILGHKMHEGRAWIKAKRIRNRRNLRSSEHWIPAEVFGKREPAKLAFYIFENSVSNQFLSWEVCWG